MVVMVDLYEEVTLLGTFQAEELASKQAPHKSVSAILRTSKGANVAGMGEGEAGHIPSSRGSI